MKKHRDHTSAMLVAKYFQKGKIFGVMSKATPKLQFMDATTVESLLNGNMSLRDT
jgi:hypothetical protein